MPVRNVLSINGLANSDKVCVSAPVTQIVRFRTIQLVPASSAYKVRKAFNPDLPQGRRRKARAFARRVARAHESPQLPLEREAQAQRCRPTVVIARVGAKSRPMVHSGSSTGNAPEHCTESRQRCTSAVSLLECTLGTGHVDHVGIFIVVPQLRQECGHLAPMVCLVMKQMHQNQAHRQCYRLLRVQ